MKTAVNSEIKFAEINGRKLAYRSIGEGQPFILANRFRGDLDVWDPLFLDKLAEKYTIITFDYTGLASSTGTPGTSILDFAKDIKDLADALGYKKIIAGGWSFGGFAAVVAATEFPELITHTVVIGANPPGENNLPIEEMFFDVSKRPEYTIEDETYLFFEPASERSKKAAVRSRERIAERTNGHDKKVLEELWNHYTLGSADYAVDPTNAREKLKKLQNPVLVIMGDHDVCFPVENWYALNRQLKNTHLIVFPEAGHGPQHEYPELTASYIFEFIKNIQ